MSLSALLLDTETTSVDNPEVIEIAYMGPLHTPLSEGVILQTRYRPSKPISLGALATHHIIMDDLQDEMQWPGRWDVHQDMPGVGYLVGHNIDFDWRAIGSPANLKRICTLALARHVWPSLDSHKLSALIYHLYPHAMARELVKNAHNAAADVDLLHRVLSAIWDAVGSPHSWDELWEISERARIPERITFGKYQGMLIRELRKFDGDYVRWLLSGKCDQVNNDPYLRKALTQ